eukprot:1145264-Rhodomonas_salina.3
MTLKCARLYLSGSANRVNAAAASTSTAAVQVPRSESRSPLRRRIPRLRMARAFTQAEVQLEVELHWQVEP